MIITNVKLENWKNFRNVDIELGKRVFFIGPNASGKSNFLDAFKFLRDVAERGIRQAVEDRGGISRIRCLSARQRPDVTIGVVIDDEFEYELTFGGHKGESPEVVREIARKHIDIDGEKKWVRVLDRPDSKDNADEARLSQTALEQVNANKKFRDVPDFFKTIAYRHILPQVVRDPKGFSHIPVKNDPYGRDFVLQLWNTTDRKRIPRLKRINEVLKLAVPQLENLDVDMDKATGIVHLTTTYQHWRSRGARQDEFSLSDGTIRLLALLWSLFEEGGPLLLEEPELSLHDEVVRQLPGMFSRLERTRKKTIRQLLISTHSKELLSDQGIGPGEVFRLIPGDNGTEILPPESVDVEMMRRGLTVADVLLPKTRPEKVGQLSLFEL